MEKSAQKQHSKQVKTKSKHNILLNPRGEKDVPAGRARERGRKEPDASFEKDTRSIKCNCKTQFDSFSRLFHLSDVARTEKVSVKEGLGDSILSPLTWFHSYSRLKGSLNRCKRTSFDDLICIGPIQPDWVLQTCRLPFRFVFGL